MRSKKGAKYIITFLLICIILFTAINADAALTFDTVRVVLARQAGSFDFKIDGDYQLVNLSTGKIITKLRKNEKWQVKLQAGQMEFQSPGGNFGSFSGPVAVQEVKNHVNIISESRGVADRSTSDLSALNAKGKAVMLFDNTSLFVKSAQDKKALTTGGGLNLISLLEGSEYGRYRGSIEFRFDDGNLMAINELNIEDYLRGVVPAEMPSSWPAEALKAQAVVARNYALQKVEATKGQSYNLTNDQFSQVYHGYDAESPAADQAIEDTRGIVMLNRGNLISAFFHSSSGGYTENSEDVWSNPLPYIKHKDDPYDKNGQHYNWQVNYTTSQLVEQLKAAGYIFKEITDIDELARTASGARVKKLAVNGIGPDGKPLHVEISNADNVRIALGLKSALFTLNKVYDKEKKLAGVNISGSGWGHGLGLSQWGACGMARQGYNYQDILKYYYTDINFASSYGR
ncbi:MAG: Amidase enhancer precursor [Pelotomaculum sp. PtaU1.Bin035]|nr:MAG: Amidase enhancer precursor [Pelotomaculum sp. PtaU1.Bin035]